MKNIKKYDEFVNESVVVDILGFLVLCGWIFWAGVGIWAVIRAMSYIISNKVFRSKSKKMYEVFLKYKDDPVIKPILIEYAKLASSGGEMEADGSKQEHYEQMRLDELSKIFNDRLKELMGDKKYQEFYKYRYNIIGELKKKFYAENPEEYRKRINYVPDWDKDTMVDKFLEDASDFFNQGYKARNWRDRVRGIIEAKWIIENDNIVLENYGGEEEEGDDDVVYIDEVTNEFLRDITKDSFHEGYRERNFRSFLSHMIEEKGYKISKKEKEIISEKKKEKSPCWDGYTMVGMKQKNGKRVPN